MPPFSGFIGPTYGGRSAAADSERSINLFLESIESPEGATKTRRTLLSKPGLATFATLGATTPSAAAAVTIPPALIGYEFASSPYGQFAFEYNGSEYTFMYQAGAGPLGSGDVKVHALKSTNGGSSWSELDAADAPALTAPGFFTAVRDGATVIVLLVNLSARLSTGLTCYHFNLTTGLWGSPVSLTNVPTLGIVSGTRYFVQLVLRAAGDYVLFYSGPIEASTYARCYYATFNGTTFGTPVELPGQSGLTSSFSPLAVCCDSSLNTHFFYNNGANDYHVALTSGAAFGTATLLTNQDYLSRNGSCSLASVFTASGTETVAIAMSVYSGSNVNLVMFSGAATLNPTFTQTTITADQSLIVYPDGTDIVPISVGLAASSSHLHCIWIVSDTGTDLGNFNFYWSYAALASPTTWSTPKSIASLPSDLTAQDGRGTQINVYANAAGVGAVIVWAGYSDNEVSQFLQIADSSLNIGSVRAECAINGRAFAIGSVGAQNYFFEVKSDGTSTGYGSALPGDKRPQMCASQTQILILAGGQGFIFDLRANTLTAITAAGFPVGAIKAGFLDGYFIVLEPNSQTFAISALNNGLAWDALDFGDAEGEPGNITTFVVDHRQIWFLGNNHGEIYYNSGDANFPISRLEGAFMEQGCSAVDSAFQCDNTIFWKGGNRDGENIFWRANGYTPERISTYAIEALVDSFGDTSDCSGYCYQEGGHTFARWDFPSACSGRGASLLYDVGEQSWHERGWWDASLGVYRADLARCHMFVFNQHLVGDYRSGNIYVQSMDYATDAGNPIRRLRAAPDLANGGKWTFYGEFRLLMETGVGLDGGVIPGTDPQCYLQISNDGGKTWEQERPRSMGPLGNYRTTVRWTPNGRSNNRVFRWICSEPVKVVLIAADLDAQ